MFSLGDLYNSDQNKKDGDYMETKKAPKGRCECCLYYEFDEGFGCMACTVPLDEDEALHYARPGSSCPYFRWYDEYKSVQKQN